MLELVAAGVIGMLIGVIIGAVAGMVCTCLIMYKGKYEEKSEQGESE